MNGARSSPSKFQRLLEAVRRRDAKAGVEADRRDIVSLFDLDGVDHQVLADVAFGMVKAGLRPAPDADACDRSWDLPLLHKALRAALLTDPLLELIFTAARRRYLDRVSRGEDLAAHDRRMMVSLACQAFNNEYVWFAEPEEEVLAERVASAVSEPAAPAASVVARWVAAAMYRSGRLMIGAEAAVASARALDWPDISDLCDARTHAEELEIRETIRSIGMPDDAIGQAVRAQYEESPYPRWFGTTLVEPTSLRRKLSTDFGRPDAGLNGERLKILVAGCGTGQHPIQVASKYDDVDVLALDVSLSSLAYAIRETRRMGLAHIDFVHGDLCRVKELGQQFDVIECIGVLHHMEDPSHGLRCLLSVLRPGGYLRIGLYRRCVRAALAEHQREAAAAMQANGTRGLRRVRRALLTGERPDVGRVLATRDFYYLSGGRDLLSHAHEVAFTPAELKRWLAAAHLEFLGYTRMSKETIAQYQREFSSDVAMRDLDSWDQFEQGHPEIFLGLQIFWACPVTRGARF